MHRKPLPALVLLCGIAAASPLSASDDTRLLSFGGQRFDPVLQAASFRAAPETAGSAGLRLVQFERSPSGEARAALESSGLRVLQYYPHNAYLLWGDDAAAARSATLSGVRWQGGFSPDWKLSPELKGRLGKIDNVQVLVYDDGNLPNVYAQIQSFGGQIRQVFPSQPDRAFQSVIVSIDAGQLALVNALPQVLWSEYASPVAVLEDELSSQIIGGNYNASNVVTAPGYIPFLGTLGLNGDGVVWAVTDTGIDYDNPEFAGRIVGGHDYAGCTSAVGRPGDDKSTGGHGTHVAGIIGGAGVVVGGVDASNFHYGIGVAPAVGLVALNPICGGAGATWPPAGGWQELSKRALLLNAIGSNGSWTSGEGQGVGYIATARTHDFMVRDGNFDTAGVNEAFMMVFSAGNSGPNASTITSPKEAKNVIVVGGTQNQRVGAITNMYGSSSRGPAIDGRTLPTIVTPGQQIASTRRVAGGSSCGTAIGAGPLTNYSFCTGTSMASPHAAGTAVLLTEWWRDNNGGTTPSPAMIKALLVNGAVDIAGAAAAIPNNDEGWGRVHLPGSLGRSLPSVYVDQSTRLDNAAEVFERTYGVPESGQPVRITLAWTDAPGAVGANPALVNNLDLEVVVGGTTYRGNVFAAGQSTTGGSADNRNIVENVYLPAGTSAVTVRVIATALPGDGVPNTGDTTDQDFALVCNNCAEAPGFTVSMATTSESICAGTPVNRSINVGTILGFNSPVTMTSTGLPAPGTVGFTPNPVNTLPGTTQMALATSGVAGGEYTVTATGTSGSIVRSSSFQLFVSSAAPAASTLSVPANNATGVANDIQFEWTASAQAFDYVVDVATDAAFNNIVRTTTTRNTTWTPSPSLAGSTQYYWRVLARNACGNSTGGAVSTFTTRDFFCVSPNLAIPDNNATGVTSDLVIPNTGAITDLNMTLNVTHTYLGDLQFKLRNVGTGTEVIVFNRSCGTNENMDVTFDDEAAIPITCSTTPPALSGSQRPANPLSAFDTQALNNTWRLTAIDLAGSDVGTVNQWCLSGTFGAPTWNGFANGFE